MTPYYLSLALLVSSWYTYNFLLAFLSFRSILVGCSSLMTLLYVRVLKSSKLLSNNPADINFESGETLSALVPKPTELRLILDVKLPVPMLNTRTVGSKGESQTKI